MRCPACGTANALQRDECAECGASITYLRDNVYLGRQFAFFDASPARPMVVDLAQAGQTTPTEHQFTTPTIISRHEFAVHFGPASPEQEPSFVDRLFGRPRRRIDLPEVLPIVELPALDLVTVTTDRKIYRPEDDVHIFVVGLNCAGQEAELEVQLAGQRVYHTRVILNDAGLHLHLYAGLEEGEYAVVVNVADQPGAQAECTFSCAEFTLSPLIAVLESHQVDREQLGVEIRLTQLNVPYDGTVEVSLRSGDRKLETQSVHVKDGALVARFDLRRQWAWEALTIEIVTPEGNTATAALPGTGLRERQRVRLSPLDVPVEASLVPFADAEGEIRGLHYTHVREEDTPFELVDVIAEQGRLRAIRDATLVHVLAFDPIKQTHRRFEFRDVSAGDELTFDVDTPYSVFTLGAFMARGHPYEAWGVVIRPVELDASIDAPAAAVPGQPVVLRLQTSEVSETSEVSTHCLLLVYDVRLEHEDPLPKLARRIFTQVQDGTRGLGEQRLQEVATAGPDQTLHWWGEFDLLDARFGAQPVRMLQAQASPMAMAADADFLRDVGELETITLTPLLVAPREAFPELAFVELFPVDGPVEKTIRLGDQIGTWRCRAYFFHGCDYAGVTHDIEASQDVYAELDLPAIVGEGDELIATARYHSKDVATLTVATPTDQSVHIVAGDGIVEFPLTAPGEITTHIATEEISDTSRRWVDPPGVETVTASRLMLLQRDETVTGRRVVVYPSIGPLLQTTIDYLVHYPFG
ncbi:MAG: hypothetical protein ACE5LU_06760 [Anaerolineae bacterium]